MTKSDNQQYVGLLLATVLLMLIILSAQTFHFHGLGFRVDEVWRVYNMDRRSVSELLQVMTNDLNMPGYFVIVGLWSRAFGYSEAVARHLSMLIFVLTLAFNYRTAADLFNHQVAFWSVLLLGATPIVFFYTRDAGTYTLLTLATATTTFCLIRWVKSSHVGYAIGYVAAGIVGVYGHYYVALLIMSHMLVCLLLMWRDWRRLAYIFWLCVAIALALVGGWGVTMLNLFDKRDLIRHISAASLSWNLIAALQINPLWLGIPLFGLGLIVIFFKLYDITHTIDEFKGGQQWFPPLIVVSVLGLALVVNLLTNTLYHRYLMTLIPAMVMIMACGILILPRPVRWLVAAVLIYFIVVDFHLFHGAQEWYRVAEHICERQQPNSRFIINSDSWVGVQPINFYVRERVQFLPSNDDVAFITEPSGVLPAASAHFPAVPDVFIHEDTVANREALLSFIRDTDQVWYIESEPIAYSRGWTEMFRQSHYLHETTNVWHIVNVSEYRKLPDDLGTIYDFGGAMTWVGWQMDQTVLKPCETIVIDTLWQGNAVPVAYSMNMSVVAEDGLTVTSVDGALTDVPSNAWGDGLTYHDRRLLTMPCDVVAGVYSVGFTVYDSQDVSTPPVTTVDGVEVSDWVYVTSLTVE